MRQPQEVTAFLDILILSDSPAKEKLNHDIFNVQFTRFSLAEKSEIWYLRSSSLRLNNVSGFRVGRLGHGQMAGHLRDQIQDHF